MNNGPEEMTMDQIEKLVRRPALYNNVDGVGELGLGFLLLGCGLPASLPIQSPIWHKWGSFVWFMVLIAAIHYGSKAIKEHITYRRTGFIEYRKQKARRWLSFTLGGVTAIAAWGLAHFARSHSDLVGSHWGMTTPVALIGLVIVVFYVLHIVSVVRWKWAVAAAMAICSVAIAMLPAGVVGGVAGSTSAVATLSERSFGAWLLTITIYGAIFLISGGISFVLYMRRTQPAAETAE
jgi:hypothetical protein